MTDCSAGYARSGCDELYIDVIALGGDCEILDNLGRALYTCWTIWRNGVTVNGRQGASRMLVNLLTGSAFGASLSERKRVAVLE